MGVFGFQLIFGTLFIIYYGIFTANAEAGSLLVTTSPEESESLVNTKYT